MSAFIKMTSFKGKPIYCHREDVKAVKRATLGEYTQVLLYGAEPVWLEVQETPAEVIELVEGPKHILGATPSDAFFGRN